MPNINEMIKTFRIWPLEINKAKELLNETEDLNLPVKFDRSKFMDPLLAIIESYPFLDKELFDKYKGYDVYDLPRQMSFFETHHISNEYLPVIIQLFIENGYDIHADDGLKAAIVLASLYYGPKYMDSYVLDAARMIIREEPRVLDIIRKHIIYGGTEEDDEDEDDSYLDLDDDLYRAYTLFGRICWDEDDCIVPFDMYPEQHKCTVWRKLLETCFEGKDPADIDYYNRLYGQKITDIILPDFSPETRPERNGQYIIDGNIILICERNIAVIEKWGSLYIDDSVEYRKQNHAESIPSTIKSIIGHSIVSVDSHQRNAHSAKYRIIYPGYELTIKLSNGVNLIVTDRITEDEKTAIENGVVDSEDYQIKMRDYWNKRVYVE